MENKNWWNNEVEEEWKRDSLQQVMQALSSADKALKPPVKDMFTDVYDKPPSRLRRQHQECMNHVAKYQHEYPTGLYVQDEKITIAHLRDREANLSAWGLICKRNGSYISIQSRVYSHSKT